MYYEEAINKALKDLSKEKNLLIVGQGVSDGKRVFETTKDLKNVLETPISEEGVTGFCIGLSLNGYIPVLSHIRFDFLFCGMNQLINMASKIRGMFGEQQKLPFIIRAIIGRSWGQGAQHSQGAYPVFCHFPNLNVYAPVRAFDAYVSLNEGAEKPDPTLIIEHRKLYGSSLSGVENINVGILNKAEEPKLTIVGVSRAAIEAYIAASYFSLNEIDVLYPFYLNPLKIRHISDSVRESKKLIVVENSWVSCGISSEIITRLHEKNIDFSFKRVGFFNGVCPSAKNLEEKYYENEANNLVKTISDFMGKSFKMKENGLKEEFKKQKGVF